MRVYKVMAANMNATYRAGEFLADTADEAIEKAREAYRNSPLGRTLKDVGSFRFYIVSEFPEN